MTDPNKVAMDLIALGLKSLTRQGVLSGTDTMPITVRIDRSIDEPASFSVALHRHVTKRLLERGWARCGDNSFQHGTGTSKIVLTDAHIEGSIESAIQRMIDDACRRIQK